MISTRPQRQGHRARSHLLVLFLVLNLLGGSAVFAVETPSGKPLVGLPLPERGTLTVGALNDSYPSGYLDEKGAGAGFNYDVWAAAAKAMNIPFRLSLDTNLKVQERFRNGEFDLLLAVTQTNERENYADFSVPFLILKGAIFVQKKPVLIKELADLNERKFAIVGKDGIANQFFKAHGIQLQVVLVSSVEEGLRLVDSGECVGVYASNLTALTLIARNKLRNVVQLDFPINDQDIRHCFAVHKGDAQLLARLNEGLAVLHRTGEFNEIYNRWYGNITAPPISRQGVINYGLAGLFIALLGALWGLQRQRKLRQRISKQANELIRQQALLQTLYDNIPIAMCVLEAGPTGYHVLSINRQAEPYFIQPATSVKGRPLLELASKSEWLTHLNILLQRDLATKTYLREERFFSTANHHHIFTFVPMTPDSEGPARLCVLSEDITERRNLDNEIAQSRKLRAIGELVGGIAHEFNNLLTPIMLKIGQIQTDWSHDAALVNETRLITQAVQRSAELTKRLLTFGRKTDHAAEEISLDTTINNCYALLHLTMDRRITWEQNVEAGLPTLYFSATDLNQIIINLIINARDTLLEKLAVQPGEWSPQIRIEAKRMQPDAESRFTAPPFAQSDAEGWVQLTIRDNGMGITQEIKERIFEPFFTTKVVGKGTGLGLATVWHMVNSAGGRIEVESTLGEGSAFHVYLPVRPRPAKVVMETPAPPPPTPPQKKMVRIFLAEDDSMVALTVTTVLKRDGHMVTHLPDGAAAWQYLPSHWNDFDLLILDVNMPGLDGIELARRIRAAGQYHGRIMMASGRLEAADQQQLSAIQIESILNKPFSVADLREAVSQCLQAPTKF